MSTRILRLRTIEVRPPTYEEVRVPKSRTRKPKRQPAFPTPMPAPTPEPPCQTTWRPPSPSGDISFEEEERDYDGIQAPMTIPNMNAPPAHQISPVQTKRHSARKKVRTTAATAALKIEKLSRKFPYRAKNAQTTAEQCTSRSAPSGQENRRQTTTSSRRGRRGNNKAAL